jgi:hypothetical protein
MEQPAKCHVLRGQGQIVRKLGTIEAMKKGPLEWPCRKAQMKSSSSSQPPLFAGLTSSCRQSERHTTLRKFSETHARAHSRRRQGDNTEARIDHLSSK